MKKTRNPPNFNSNSWRSQYLIHDNRTPVISKEKDLNSIINQLHLTDTYRALHPTTAQYTFLSIAQRTMSRTGPQTSLNRFFKETEIIQNIFSNHNGMKLEINSRRKTEKSRNMWKLNNILFNNQ